MNGRQGSDVLKHWPYLKKLPDLWPVLGSDVDGSGTIELAALLKHSRSFGMLIHA